MKHDHAALLMVAEKGLPSDELLCNLADIFRIFGDTTRVRILCALLDTELCVCAISELLGMTQSAISHQLRVLKDARLLGCRREGKTVYYFLADEHVRGILSLGCEHLHEGE